MSPLRKPPLCAKNWENWGFQYLTIISAPKYSEPTDLLGLVELHSSSKFLRNLIMIHVRDVIKWSFYWTDQKPFTGHSSKIIHFMIFSNQNLVQFIRKECRYCFEISKKNIRWSGNDRMFKMPYQPYTGSKKDKVKNSFLNRIVTSLRMLVF